MQSKADEEGEGCGDEEVVEVDEEEGVGGKTGVSILFKN